MPSTLYVHSVLSLHCRWRFFDFTIATTYLPAALPNTCIKFGAWQQFQMVIVSEHASSFSFIPENIYSHDNTIILVNAACYCGISYLFSWLEVFLNVAWYLNIGFYYICWFGYSLLPNRTLMIVVEDYLNYQYWNLSVFVSWLVSKSSTKFLCSYIWAKFIRYWSFILKSFTEFSFEFFLHQFFLQPSYHFIVICIIYCKWILLKELFPFTICDVEITL